MIGSLCISDRNVDLIRRFRSQFSYTVELTLAVELALAVELTLATTEMALGVEMELARRYTGTEVEVVFYLYVGLIADADPI